MNETSSEGIRRNPSRSECESAIKRILVTEVLTKGRNEQFRNASDFMPYFESLYPAGTALTKQVQRAIKSMMLPKDEHGYLIINKTEEQLEEEKDLSFFLKRSHASLSSLDGCVPVLLHCSPGDTSYLMSLILKCITLKDKYETVFETADGILFYTRQEQALRVLLESLL